MKSHPPGSFLVAGVRLTLAPLDTGVPGVPVRWLASDTAGRSGVGATPNAALSALFDLRDRLWLTTALQATFDLLRSGIDNPARQTHIARAVALYLERLGDPRILRVVGRLDDAEDAGGVALGDATRYAIEVLGVVLREVESVDVEGAALAA